jgi:hypothetical protein
MKGSLSYLENILLKCYIILKNISPDIALDIENYHNLFGKLDAKTNLIQLLK